MTTEPKPSIAEKSRDVRRGLTDLTSHLEGHQHDRDNKTPVKPSETLDSLERFTLWAGNMGAMRSPASRLSLDQRLSKAPEIQELVFQLLDDLLEAIEDLSNIVKGESENRDTACDIAIDNEGNTQIVPSNVHDTNQKPSDEASMLLTIISSCITSLFRTGILIRKAGTTDRFNSALQKSTATFHPEFDIDYVRERYPKLNGRNEATSGLSERLGKAMSKRRQFIKYSRDHQARLAYEELVEAPEDLPARTEQLSSQATSLHPDRLPAPSILPTTINEEEDEVEDDLVSMMSASTLSGSASILKLPTLGELSPDGDAFECPICFTLQSFRREKAWRVHAFRDLKAYVCTVGGKDCESELFGDRNSWFQHEMQRHRAEYTCVLCTEGPFDVQSRLESHISATHGPFTQEQLQKLQEAGRQTLTLFRARDCPFCDDWVENLRGMADPKGKRPAQGNEDSDIFVSAARFKRHVAVHQEQLAIFTIPRAVEENGTPGSGSVGTMSVFQSLSSVKIDGAFNSASPSLAWVDEGLVPDLSGSILSSDSSDRLSDKSVIVESNSEDSSQIGQAGSIGNEIGTSKMREKAFRIHKVPRLGSRWTRWVAKLRKKPFVCVFRYAGCASIFETKDQWKSHVLSQHIKPYYWICKHLECVKANPRTGGLIFSLEDLYTKHIETEHNEVSPVILLPAKRERRYGRTIRSYSRHYVVGRRKMSRCEMPTYMVCPETSCVTFFTGTSAWDDRMEHVADHIEGDMELDDPSSLFRGGDTDNTLTDWATRPDVRIVERVRNKWKLVSPTWYPVEGAAPSGSKSTGPTDS